MIDFPLARLATELTGKVAGEVRFDPGSRATYSTDASNYRAVPLGVVPPRTPEDAAAAIAVCREHDMPPAPKTNSCRPSATAIPKPWSWQTVSAGEPQSNT